MRKADLVEFFKTPAALARACDIERQSVQKWGEIIPELRARKLREKFGRRAGFPKFDPSLYDLPPEEPSATDTTDTSLETLHSAA